MLFHKLINKIGNTILPAGSNKNPYDLWIAKNEPDGVKLKAMRSDSQSWTYRPLVSIVTPVYNPQQYDLTKCIKSVLHQVYDNWELCLVDGGSDKPYVRKTFERFAAEDSRIKSQFLTKNLGIAGNSNAALKLATGEYVAFLDHDDMLSPSALYEVVKRLNDDRSVDFFYSDEDKVPADSGDRYSPFFKPEWSPDTFMSYNYLCHFAVIRKTIIEKAGGFREGYDGAQDYDLFLRVVQNTNRIRRIPKVLYHWRAAKGSAASELMAKPYALDAAKRAISGYLTLKGMEGEVTDGLFPTSYRVKYRIRPGRKVAFIIPTRDRVDLLKRCVNSIIGRTDYRDYEIVVVDNGSEERDAIEYLKSLTDVPSLDSRLRGNDVKVLSYARPFNFSAINNFAAKSTDAEVLLFLNNDTEVISGEWLSAMLEFAQRDDVGAVGAKLYYPNDTIQHAGVFIGVRGLAAHCHKDFPRSSSGYFGRLKIIQNVSAVTAACLMVRRKVFEEVGGFEERLSHAFNDVDLCLKIREKGYHIVFTPYAELYHHDSASGASKGHEVAPTPEGQERFSREKEFMRSKWKDVLAAGDPYYNPNLTLERLDFSIKL
ncbi:MAG: glycosyltransferase family 2 protein [Nitrospirae bacterium]|nr:glycosyltransferase family 2 protein [Nitrospirota bacterium]